jgi:hypothetical protein
MAIEGLKKHAGQLGNTGVRVAVVFRKLPNDDTHCLIVETERLPDSYHDYLIQCLNSRESVETNDFYEVLNRRTFPDGLNCLTALHQRGHLRKEAVSNVTMLPLPGQAVPLALINATIDGKVAEYQAKQANPPVEAPVDNRTPEEKKAAAEALAAKMMGETAPVTALTDEESKIARAKLLIAQAEDHEQNADVKRAEAYRLAPELRPGRGRPPTPEELKDQKAEERKEKRRERDREKAAQARADKAAAALNEKVEKKIARDTARVNAKA